MARSLFGAWEPLRAKRDVRRVQAAHARAARWKASDSRDAERAAEARRLKAQRGLSDRAIAKHLGVSRKRVPRLLANGTRAAR
jgi:predicted DNA-binding protein (UPF0251 family)